jgi:hypothetical protein
VVAAVVEEQVRMQVAVCIEALAASSVVEHIQSLFWLLYSLP